MAWCPVCKNEYRDGIFVCADCGVDLVSEMPKALQAPTRVGLFTEEELKARLQKSGQLPKEFEQADGSGSVDSDFAASVSDSAGFDLSESQNSDAILSDEPDIHITEKESDSFEWLHTTYRDNSQKAEDNRSSAWVLLVVGILGIGFIILSFFGIIPISFGKSYLIYGVMSAVFILFFIMGIVSMKNALVFAKKAQSDHTLEQAILDWCSNLTAEEVDAQVHLSENSGEADSYFERVRVLTEKINYQFVNLDPQFVSHIIDEKIYEKLFGAEE